METGPVLAKVEIIALCSRIVIHVVLHTSSLFVLKRLEQVNCGFMAFSGLLVVNPQSTMTQFKEKNYKQENEQTNSNIQPKVKFET